MAFVNPSLRSAGLLLKFSLLQTFLIETTEGLPFERRREDLEKIVCEKSLVKSWTRSKLVYPQHFTSDLRMLYESQQLKSTKLRTGRINQERKFFATIHSELWHDFWIYILYIIYILDHEIVILTRNYLHGIIKCILQTRRAIAQLGRAPRLHARQCFSRESIMQSKELILLKNRCLTL